MPRALALPRFAALGLALLAACPSTPAAPADAGPVARHVISDDILARPPETASSTVRHILISWADLRQGHRDLPPDPRADARTHAQAEALALEVLDRARHGEEFAELMAKYSEDLGSARVGAAITVVPNGATEPDFQALALRLHVGEVGVCQTAYGLHIVKRLR